MTFESEGLLIVAIYTWLPPASYVVFSDNSGSYGDWKRYEKNDQSPLCKPHRVLQVFDTGWISLSLFNVVVDSYNLYHIHPQDFKGIKPNSTSTFELITQKQKCSFDYYEQLMCEVWKWFGR